MSYDEKKIKKNHTSLEPNYINEFIYFKFMQNMGRLHLGIIFLEYENNIDLYNKGPLLPNVTENIHFYGFNFFLYLQ